MNIELGVEQTYEGYKKALMDLQKKREKIERRAKRMATMYRKGDETKYNEIKDQYLMIEDVTVTWFSILEMALKDFPEMKDDEDLPRGNKDSFQVFKKEEEKAKKDMEEKLIKVSDSLLINSKNVGENEI